MVLPIPLAVAGPLTLQLLPGMSNRHGLITGATGTGKTVTLQVLAEGFSRIGVPVFMADVKGDLAGLGAAGVLSPKLQQRLTGHGLQLPQFGAAPVAYWDVFAQAGHPVRATVSDLGPLLLSRMLGLNETQGGVLALAFKIADDAGLLLLDFKDLRALLEHVGNNAKDFRTSYGNVSTASIGAIQRGLLQLESQGGELLLGEPALDIADLMRNDELGRGIVNVLAAEQLLNAPRVYSTFLLWLLSEIFERMPEVGDPEKPRLVFFFDEAHLLFEEAPKAVLEKIEQVVRLVRSKGVGVWFVTQNPLDIPDSVLGQLGNRVQHALRAYTPRDQRAVKTAAETLRPNPKIDTVEAIGELGVGEALISLLDEKGRPRMVERAYIAAPGTRMGTVTGDERKELIARSALAGKYDQTIDRESAYERLKGRAPEAPAPEALVEDAPQGLPQALPPIRPREEPSLGGQLGELFLGSVGPRGGQRPGLLDSFAKSALRSAGSSVGREITRGLLGSLFGGRRR